MNVKWSYLDLVRYKDAIDLMSRLREKVRNGDNEDYLLLLQHYPVITRGNSEWGKEGGLKMPRREIERRGIEVVDSDRGGKTTYHGPGQLVGYMVMDLARRKLGPKVFVRTVLEIIQAMLDTYDIDAKIDDKRPGLYVDGEKIAFVGLNIKHNVTTHGFSLNVKNDLKESQYFVPCGMNDIRLTTMEKVTGINHSVFDVYWRFVTFWADRISDELWEIDRDELLAK